MRDVKDARDARDERVVKDVRDVRDVRVVRDVRYGPFSPSGSHYQVLGDTVHTSYFLDLGYTSLHLFGFL